MVRKTLLAGLMLLALAACSLSGNRSQNEATAQPTSPAQPAAQATSQPAAAIPPTAAPTQEMQMKMDDAPAPTTAPLAGSAGVGAAVAMQDHHLMAGPHLQLAAMPASTAEEAQRAAAFIAEALQALGKFSDYKVAEAEGYRALAPDVPQDVYHFVNLQEGLANLRNPEPGRPTALLYTKTADGWLFWGAMYSAPAAASEAELDQIFPRSAAQWHLHTNLCLPPNGDLDTAIRDDQFGFEGAITTAEECSAAGGRFIGSSLGWMVHVPLQ